MQRRNLELTIIILVAIFTIGLSKALAVLEEEGENKEALGPQFRLSERSFPLESSTGESNKKDALEFAKGELIVKLKEGKTLDDIAELNSKYGVTSNEKVFKETSSPEESLKQLKDKLAKLNVEHQSWYWQLDKDSQEYKDYITKIEKEKEVTTKQIQAQESLVTHLEARQKRATEGANPPDLTNIFLLKTKEDTNILAMASDYQANPNVEYAEPNYIVKLQMVPNDPYYSTKGSWGQGYDDLWGIKKIQTEKAWDILQGGDAIVAVADTGIDYNHPDIAANIWINLREIPNNGIDDDKNGYVDDVKGWDIGNADNDPMDTHGHGTHCAGIIGAVGNNSLGVVGVNWKVKLMAAKCFPDYSGETTSSKYADSIYYATNNGADVISMSWHDPFTTNYLTKNALDYAFSKGCILVAAAGNANMDAKYYLPANIDYIITAGASDSDDKKAWFSNFGEGVDVFAPGVDVLSLRASGTSMGQPVDAYTTRSSGTSMACPHVAGLAALILSQHPDWNASQIVACIKGSADPIDLLNRTFANTFANKLGSGRINAQRALGPAGPNVNIVNYQIDDSQGNNNKVADPGETVNFSVDLRNNWLDAYSVSATLLSGDPYITIMNNNSSFGDIGTGVTKNNLSSPFKFFIKSTCPKEHRVDFSLEIIANGFSRENKFSIIVSEQVSRELPPWPISPQGIHPFIVTGVVTDDINGDDFKDIVEINRLIKPYRDIIEVFDYQGKYLPKNWPVSLENDYYNDSTASVADLITSSPGKEVIIPLCTYISKNYDGSYSIQYTIRVFTSDGSEIKTGNWPRTVVDITGGDIAVFTPVIADLNQDGKQEVILATNRYIYVWNSDGSDFPGAWPRSITLSEASFPSVGNLDSDPQLEIVIGDSNGTLHVFNHDGSYVSGFPVQFIGRAQDSALVDIDNDGKDEIVIQFGDNNLYLVDERGSVIWTFVTDGPSATSGSGELNSPAIADVDKNGEPEIIAVSWSQEQIEPGMHSGKVYLLNTQGKLLPGWPTKTPLPIDLSPIIGDLDGDGDQEIIAVSQFSGKMFAWHHDDKDADGSADIVEGWPITIEDSSMGIVYEIPALADLDKDGDLEIIEFANYGKIHVFESKCTNPQGCVVRADWPMFRGNPQHTGRFIKKSDSTLPTTPMIIDEGAYTSNTTTLKAAWQTFDNESGIAEHQYLITQDSPVGAVVKDWTVVADGSGKSYISITVAGLSLSNGKTYYFSVKAKNGAGLWSAVGYSDGIKVDTTPPTLNYVMANQVRGSTNALEAIWWFTDSESGIAEYQYRITQDSPTGTVIRNWSSTGTAALVTATGLSLQNGTTYYFAVKAKNGAGLWSNVGYSNGITAAIQQAQTPWKTNGNGTLYTNIGWNYTMGYHFTPQKSGKITKLGGFFNGTKTVYLWDKATGALLAQANVASANNWNYTSISPVSVQAGKTYTVAVYLGSSGGSYRTGIATLPKIYADIKIEGSTYNSGNARPSNSITSIMYGQVDIEFAPY